MGKFLGFDEDELNREFGTAPQKVSVKTPESDDLPASAGIDIPIGPSGAQPQFLPQEELDRQNAKEKSFMGFDMGELEREFAAPAKESDSDLLPADIRPIAEKILGPAMDFTLSRFGFKPTQEKRQLYIEPAQKDFKPASEDILDYLAVQNEAEWLRRHPGDQDTFEAFVQGIIPYSTAGGQRVKVMEAAHPIASAVGKVAGLATAMLGTAPLEGVMAAQPLIRSMSRVVIPGLKEFGKYGARAIPRMIHFASAGFVKSTSDNALKLSQGATTLSKAASDIARSTADMAVFALPQSLAQPWLRIPATGMEQYLSGLVQGHGQVESLAQGALMIGLGLLDRSNLSVVEKQKAFRKAAAEINQRIVERASAKNEVLMNRAKEIMGPLTEGRLRAKILELREQGRILVEDSDLDRVVSQIYDHWGKQMAQMKSTGKAPIILSVEELLGAQPAGTFKVAPKAEPVKPSEPPKVKAVTTKTTAVPPEIKGMIEKAGGSKVSWQFAERTDPDAFIKFDIPPISGGMPITISMKAKDVNPESVAQRIEEKKKAFGVPEKGVGREEVMFSDLKKEFGSATNIKTESGVKVNVSLDAIGKGGTETFKRTKADENVVYIDTIESSKKGKENASKVLDKIIEIADKNQVELRLFPRIYKKEKGQLTLPQLYAWYKTRGFIANDEGMMSRKPKTEEWPIRKEGDKFVLYNPQGNPAAKTGTEYEAQVIRTKLKQEEAKFQAQKEQPQVPKKKEIVPKEAPVSKEEIPSTKRVIQYKTEPVEKTLPKFLAGKKSTLPILTYAKAEKGTITATDIETWIKTSSKLEPGFYQQVGKLLVKTSEKLDPEDYPKYPDMKGAEEMGAVDRNEFIKELERAERGVSQDETRYVLQGVFLSVKDGVATVISTNGKTLSKSIFKAPGLKDAEFIINNPDKAIAGLKTLAGKQIYIKHKENRIEFTDGTTFVNVGKIEGQFPNTVQVWGEVASQLKFDKAELAAALKELLPFVKANKAQGNIISMTRKGKAVTLSTLAEPKKSIDISVEEVKVGAPFPPKQIGSLVMPMDLQEKPGELGINPLYLQDVVSGIAGKEVFMGLQPDAAKKPYIFYGEEIAKAASKKTPAKEKKAAEGVKESAPEEEVEAPPLGPKTAALMAETAPSEVDAAQGSPEQKELNYEKALDSTRNTTIQGKGEIRSVYDSPFSVEFKKTGKLVFPKMKWDGDPASIAFAYKFLHDEVVENFWITAMKKGKVVAVELHSIGTLDEAAVFPYEILAMLRNVGADSYFLTHNHPSGKLEPSREDLEITMKIKTLLDQHKLGFKGHVITNGDEFAFFDDPFMRPHEILKHKEYSQTKNVVSLKKYREWKKTGSVSTEQIRSPQALLDKYELMKGIKVDAGEGLVFLLDKSLLIVNVFAIPSGNVDPAMITELAILNRAKNVAMVNVVKDLKTTESFELMRNIQTALGKAAIRLLDNVVKIDDNRYESAQERNLLDPGEVYTEEKLVKNKLDRFRAMTTDELENYIESRYEANAPQKELNELETVFAERISEEELGITEEELNMGEGVDLEEELVNMYARILNPNVRGGMTEKDIMENMRSAIEGRGGKQNLSDQEILGAAKDIFDRRIKLLEKYRAKEPEERYLNLIKNPYLFKGEPVWGGAYDVLDGTILYTISYEGAKEYDFHHKLYFPENIVTGMDEGKIGFFWFEGELNTQWGGEKEASQNIKNKIMEQLTPRGVKEGEEQYGEEIQEQDLERAKREESAEASERRKGEGSQLEIPGITGKDPNRIGRAPEEVGLGDVPAEPTDAPEEDWERDVPSSQEMPMRLEKPEGAKGATNAPEIIQSLAHILEAAGREIPIRNKHFRNKALGIFKVNPEVIRILTANDIPTAAHEVFHALEKAIYGWTKGGAWTGRNITGEMQRELAYLGKLLYGSRIPKGGYKREGFAEFGRMYLTDQEQAKKLAPKFFEWFEGKFLKLYPEIAKEIAESKKLIDAWKEMGAQERVKASMVDLGSLEERTRRTKGLIKNIFAIDKWIEMLEPLNAMAREAEKRLGRKLAVGEDPYTIAKALRHAYEGRTAYMVEQGMIDISGNIVGPALDDIRALVRGRYSDFGAYLYARRAEALWIDPNRGPRNPGITLEDAQQTIKELENPKFQLVAQKIYDWNDGVLNYAAQASPEFARVVEKIRATSSGYYVPLQRHFDEIDDIIRKTGGGVSALGGSISKRLKGSGRRIKDIFPQMISNARNIVKAAHNRIVIDRIIKLSKVEGLGRFAERIPKDKVPVKIRTEDILRNMAKAGLELSGNEDLTPEEILESMPLGETMTFFMEAQYPKGNEPIVAVMEGGKIVWYQLDPELFHSLSSLEVPMVPHVNALVDLILNAAHIQKQVFTMGTTGARASFSLLWNWLRDLPTGFIQSQAKANPAVFFGNWLASMGGAFVSSVSGKNVDPYFDLYMRLGGALAQSLGQDIAYTRRSARRLFETTGMRIIDVRNWWDYIREVLQFPESATRTAELRSIAQDLNWKPGEQISFEQSIKMLLAAKEVTTDFSAGGEFGRLLNMFIPYLNPAIQGPRAGVRAAGRDPKKFIFRGLWITALALLAWWHAKDKKWWKRGLSYRDKLLHFWFESNVGGRKELVRIPMPFELGLLFGGVPLTIMDAWYQKDPKMVKEFFHIVLDVTTPNALPPVINEALSQAMNQDTFWKTPIVSMGQERKPAKEQYTPYTTNASIAIGRMFDVSPSRVEHALRGVLGPVSIDIAELFGRGGRNRNIEKEPADIPVIGRMFRRGGPMGTNPQIIQDMYDLLEKANLKQASDENPETSKERDLRLMLSDAADAVSALNYIAKQTQKVDKRRELVLTATKFAREAVLRYNSENPERRDIKKEAKGYEKEAEGLKIVDKFVKKDSDLRNGREFLDFLNYKVKTKSISKAEKSLAIKVFVSERRRVYGK